MKVKTIERINHRSACLRPKTSERRVKLPRAFSSRMTSTKRRDSNKFSFKSSLLILIIFTICYQDTQIKALRVKIKDKSLQAFGKPSASRKQIQGIQPNFRTFVYKGLVCNPSSFQITCKNLKTGTIFKKLTTDFFKQYGKPFQLHSPKKSRIVLYKGLRWTQSGREWSIKVHHSRTLKLSDYHFNELYNRNSFFSKDGAVLGRLARCKADRGGRFFNCKMPWMKTWRLSKNQLVDTFAKKGFRRTKNGLCKSFKTLLFWNLDGRRWRCWNYYFWPESTFKQKGEEEGVPSSKVMDYYEFNRKYGNIQDIIKEQPDPVVNSCAFNMQKRQITGRMVWDCDLRVIEHQSEKEKEPFWPSYLPKRRRPSKRFIIRKSDMEKMVHSEIPTLRALKGVIKIEKKFVAITTHLFKTRFLSYHQFDNIFGDKAFHLKRLRTLYAYRMGRIIPVEFKAPPKRKRKPKKTGMGPPPPKGVNPSLWANPAFRKGFYAFEVLMKKKQAVRRKRTKKLFLVVKRRASDGKEVNSDLVKKEIGADGVEYRIYRFRGLKVRQRGKMIQILEPGQFSMNMMRMNYFFDYFAANTIWKINLSLHL